MSDAAEAGTSLEVPTSDPRAAGDMAPLVRRVREFLEAHGGEITILSAGEIGGDPACRPAVTARGHGRPEVVLAEETAVELGHPSTESLAIVLTTGLPDLVEHGRITLLGPDIGQMKVGARAPFAQIVLAATRPGSSPNRFDLENAQYLTHRLSGYMVRSVPGRLWARVSFQGRAAGLGFGTIGASLVAAYADRFEEILEVEVVFVTSGPSQVREIAPIAAEAAILAGRHKKLLLRPGGEVECPDLDCENCDEKTVCDGLRDVVVARRGRGRR